MQNVRIIGAAFLWYCDQERSSLHPRYRTPANSIATIRTNHDMSAEGNGGYYLLDRTEWTPITRSFEANVARAVVRNSEILTPYIPSAAFLSA